jgi:protein gp37
VSGAQVILEHGTDEEKQAVESGKSGISKLEKIARERKKEKKQVNPDAPKSERKKPEYEIEDIGNGIFIQKLNSNTKPTFNETNENIEWAKWSWNPVTGCKFGCDYCYARKIAENSRYEQVRPTGFEPTFHPDRLKCPDTHSIPVKRKDEPGINNVFLCSMADLWGDWVPSEWIQQILDVIAQHPEYNFISLTKNPKRYRDFEFPENIWLGATADTQERFNVAMDVFSDLPLQENYCGNIKFLSCEPLLEHIRYDHNASNLLWNDGCAGQSTIDWVIIGSLKGSENSDKQPKWEWVETLIDFARKSVAKVYFKTNLTVTPKELPF